MSNPILVVEDNDDLLLLFQLVLESAGYEVETASNAKDALSLVAQHKPQLVVMDIMMPGENGLQISNTIKQKQDYDSVPILLVSAIDRLKERDLDFSKADDILYKPFDIDDLIICVDKLVGYKTER